MAASSTPVKCLYFSSDIQACVLCAKKLTKRLHCLAKFKSTKQNYVKIIEQFTGLVLDPSLLCEMYVCETCVGKCQGFMDFKRICVDSIESFENAHKRLKRLPKTPPSSLRHSVAEQIENSIEKLKKLELGGTKKSRQKLSFDSCGDTQESTVDPNITSAPDHISYCKFQPVQNKEDDAGNETNLLDLMEHFNSQAFLSSSLCSMASTITKSIENVCKGRNSVLFVKDPFQLMNKNWMREVSSEMSEKCSELFQILFAAIGDRVSPESKLATISTIYGMILHCRNVKACAIQRIYSALCIRYHADNKRAHIWRSSKIAYTGDVMQSTVPYINDGGLYTSRC